MLSFLIEFELGIRKFELIALQLISGGNVEFVEQPTLTERASKSYDLNIKPSEAIANQLKPIIASKSIKGELFLQMDGVVA